MAISYPSTGKKFINSYDRNFILAIGSLFEGDFSVDWLVELTGQKPSIILDDLQAEVDTGLLKSPKIGNYCFAKPEDCKRFALYLNDEKRKDLHRQVVTLLLDSLPESNEKPYILAHHLLQCANDVEHCRILAHCGDVYRKNFQAEQAYRCYTKVLNDLSKITEEEADHLYSDTAIKYSKTSMARQDTHIVLSRLKEAFSRAKQWGNLSNQALLKMHIAKNEWLQGNYPQAISHFEEGWSIAESINTPEITRSVTTFGIFFLYWQGRFRDAVQTYEKSFPEIENHPRQDFPSMAAMTLGRCYTMVGQIPRGLGMLDSMREYCLDMGNQQLASHVIAAIEDVMLDTRCPEKLSLYGDEVLKLAEKSNNRWVWINAQAAYAFAYFLRGSKDRSIGYLKQYLKHSRRVHTTVQLNPYLLELGWAIEQGLLPGVKDFSLENEIEYMITSGNVYTKGLAYRFQAMLRHRQGKSIEDIRQSYNHSIEWLTESGHIFDLARSLTYFARFLADTGHNDEADRIVKQAAETISFIDNKFIPEDLRSISHRSRDDKQLLKDILVLGQQIVLVRNVKDLFHHIISSVNRLIGAERGAIFLLEGDSSGKPEFRLRASINLTPEQIDDPGFAPSMRMIEQTYRSKKAKTYNIGDDVEPKSLIQNTLSSMVCVPMVNHEKTVGVLYHDNRLLKSAFKESDLELLAYFAAQSAFALQNAKAYEEIYSLNRKLSEEKRFQEEDRLITLPFDEIIGESRAIKKVLKQIEQVASLNTNVLILGETGVGKELVARAIHRHGVRKDKPFIRAHLSSIPNQLIPSELFGHEKGAFTDAKSQLIGRFELADGGTLFLDEIGELPEDIQIRLLRVLQTHEFERIGSSKTMKSDFRLITATNRDLEKHVMLGHFRSDLYYRLNVFPILVPPLRKRTEDIPFLAQHFLNIHCAKIGKHFDGIPKEEMEKMMSYDWPGNVRELENVIERGTILSTGSGFMVPDSISQSNVGTENSKYLTLKDNERHYILRSLEKTNWKVSGPGGSAELLDIPPSTLEFKMKKLGIQRPMK